VSLPTVLYLGPAALCVLAWLGPSALLPRPWLARQGLLLETLTRLAGGSVALSLLTFVLGLAGAFDRGVLIGITVALALPGAAFVRRLRPGRLRLRDLPDPVRLLLGLVVLALVLDLVAATAPPTSADAIRYHLGAPRWWLQLGRIDEPFWDWHAFSPFGTEMLYAHGIALAGGEAAGALGAVFAVLAAAAVFGLARELGAGDAVAGAIGAALFVLQGVVTWEATSAFVELCLTFYALVAAWYAVRFARTRARADAIAAGAFAGAAAGTKYLGLVAGAIVLAGLALPGLARRRAGALAAAVGAAVVVCVAWYARNAAATGNPFYPVFFGGRHWTPAAQGVLDLIDEGFGLHETILRLPLLPYDLLAHGGAFDKGRYVGTAIFVLALLAPLARRRRPATLVFAGSVVFVAGWWELSQQARFLLPALGALAAAGGAGSAALLRRRPRLAPAVAVVLLAATAVWAGSSFALTRRLLPSAVGAESRARTLQRLTGTYDAYRRIHARYPGRLGLVDYPFPFNYPGRAVPLDVPDFATDVPRDLWLRRLRALRVRYVLAANLNGSVPELAPVRACLVRLETFHARYVLSRSRGTSRPLDLELYSPERCRG
jgi:hypothetical protein